MAPTRRIAFIANMKTGYFQRLLRDLCRFADEHSILIRGFTTSQLASQNPVPPHTSRSLNAFMPDGILSGLMDDGLDRLLAALSRPTPVVNLVASTPRPGVAVLTGSLSSLVATAARHLQTLGINSVAVFSAESGIENNPSLRQTIQELSPSSNPRQALLFEPIDLDIVEDPDAPVTPIPKRLMTWLRGLPKPAGVLCPGLGGGNYLLRVCRELQMRVPEDVAVVGTDDTEACLLCHPTLTSVIPSTEQLANEAMKALAQMMAGHPAPKNPVRIEAMELHVRQSTGMRRELCDVAAAVEFINRHACEGIGVTEVLAETQWASRMTFYREFEKATGQSPGKAIRERRIDVACGLLLNTELSTAMIASSCGFSNSSAFSRAFRLSRGMSPIAFRRKKRSSSS